MRFLFPLLLIAAVAGPAFGQTATVLDGRLVNSFTGGLSPARLLSLTSPSAKSSRAGRHIPLRQSRRRRVPPVGARAGILRAAHGNHGPHRGGAPVELRVDFDLHFQEVASVSAEARSQFDAFQPTTVLSGQEPAKQLESSLGATLDNHRASLTQLRFGAVAAGHPRPRWRPRADSAGRPADGRPVKPVGGSRCQHESRRRRRIEVVRGPATLLYGANAIGGLVNVITNEVPTRPVQGASGELTFDSGTSAKKGRRRQRPTWERNVGAEHRRRRPAVRRLQHAAWQGHQLAFAQRLRNLGLAWTGTRLTSGQVTATTTRSTAYRWWKAGRSSSRPAATRSRFGPAEQLSGAFEAFRATVALRKYTHDELEGTEIGTSFSNDTTELQLMGSHGALGRMKGSVGGWALNRAFDAVGAEALSPAVRSERVGGLCIRGGHLASRDSAVRWPFRSEHGASPAGEPQRDFANGSLSAGLLLRPAAADDRVTIAASIAHAARAPALEEMFFFGVQPGNFALEVGNPGLESERALGVDVALRWRTPRASGEVTYFRNDINDYIFRRNMDEEEFNLRLDDFVARFGGRPPAGVDEARRGRGPVRLRLRGVFGADALLQGIESHADFQLTPTVTAEPGLDFVHGP